MNTNSNISSRKILVGVEALHLDEFGYGPLGKHTRREWRKECQDNFQAGEAIFTIWQKKWIESIDHDLVLNSGFGCKLTYSNNEIEYYTNAGSHAELKPYTIDFSGCIFGTLFMGFDMRFLETAIFSGSIFNNGIMLLGARFEKSVNFSKSAFNGVAVFGNCTFEKITNFRNLVCNSTTGFSYSTFNQYVSFSESTFKGEVDFESVTFNSKADFIKVIFESSSRFHNRFDKIKKIWKKETSFADSVDFENAVFKNVGHFERVSFYKNIPSFLGVDTAATRLEFSDDQHFPKLDFSERAIKRLGHLKRLSDEHGQTDQALMFNALELRAKANHLESGIVLKIITGLYEILSNYGRSFIRPIIFYIILICLSFMYSYTYTPSASGGIMISNNEFCKPSEKEPQLLNLSRQQAAFEYAMFRAGGVMDFTDAGKQNNAVNCRLFEEPFEPPLMRAWGVFKGIASIALLFLAALGLRNKYRIK